MNVNIVFNQEKRRELLFETLKSLTSAGVADDSRAEISELKETIKRLEVEKELVIGHRCYDFCFIYFVSYRDGILKMLFKFYKKRL